MACVVGVLKGGFRQALPTCSELDRDSLPGGAPPAAPPAAPPPGQGRSGVAAGVATTSASLPSAPSSTSGTPLPAASGASRRPRRGQHVRCRQAMHTAASAMASAAPNTTPARAGGLSAAPPGRRLSVGAPLRQVWPAKSGLR